MDKGVTINRPPRDGNMAFVRSPDNISIELLQKGPRRLEPQGALGVRCRTQEHGELSFPQPGVGSRHGYH